MKILIYDTETTGFPPNCHLVQYAAHICDISFDKPLVIQEFSTLVQCPIEVPERAFEVHGINKDMASRGLHAQQVAEFHKNQANKCDLVVAHNNAFDTRVMNKVAQDHGVAVHGTATFCTMMASTSLCKLPGNKGGYKWPKLAEALDLLCNHKLEGAHDALADVRGALKLFLYLNDQGLVPKQ